MLSYISLFVLLITPLTAFLAIHLFPRAKGTILSKEDKMRSGFVSDFLAETFDSETLSEIEKLRSRLKDVQKAKSDAERKKLEEEKMRKALQQARDLILCVACRVCLFRFEHLLQDWTVSTCSKVQSFSPSVCYPSILRTQNRVR